MFCFYLCNKFTDSKPQTIIIKILRRKKLNNAGHVLLHKLGPPKTEWGSSTWIPQRYQAWTLRRKAHVLSKFSHGTCFNMSNVLPVN